MKIVARGEGEGVALQPGQALAGWRGAMRIGRILVNSVSPDDSMYIFFVFVLYITPPSVFFCNTQLGAS